MIKPTPIQIETVTRLLTASITELVNNDSGILGIQEIVPPDLSDNERVLYRKLHETTINHRLAFYLEKNMLDTEINYYKVDIEYNKNYNEQKQVQTVEGILNIRPDIIIHSRVDERIQPQHFLVIEAKKDRITQHDINKIKGLITDDNYNYVFGFTVSYCRDKKFILGNLYYFNGEAIEEITLNVARGHE